MSKMGEIKWFLITSDFDTYEFDTPMELEKWVIDSELTPNQICGVYKGTKRDFTYKFTIKEAK